jgi:putative ABC transport system permease protein
VLSLATDNVLILNLGNSLPPEAERVGEEKGFVDAATIERLNQRLLAIPGVTAAAASWTVPDETFSSTVDVIAPDRRGDKHVTVSEQVMEPGYFELYGVKPVAGRSFDREHGIDRVPVKGGVEGAVIINESAVRQLGFVSSTEAIDHVIDVELASGATQPRRIIGIVPDYPIGSIRERVPPTIFRVDATAAHYMNIKLSSGDIAAKLVAIEMVWRDFVPNRRAEYAFLDQRVERQYRDLIRQRDIAVGFALTSILIACFGLFGLSAFTAARRTKEIGIRKAMGAGTVDIVRLLVWQFLRPVVMANLLAWPVAALLMQRWLEGFVYHIPLDASVFLAATGAALVLAVVTISFHAVAVAQTHPSASLRYE